MHKEWQVACLLCSNMTTMCLEYTDYSILRLKKHLLKRELRGQNQFSVIGRYFSQGLVFHSSIDGLFQSNDRPVWDMLPGDVAQRLPAGKRRNPDRNERTKESETPPKTGAGTTAEGTGKMNTETIPKHNNFTGHSLPCP